MMVEEMSMEEMKTTRSSLKMKLTISANRVKASIGRKSSERTIIQSYEELECVYSDFQSADFNYAAAVEADEEVKAAYGTVNNLDCTAYTAVVDGMFNTAKAAYDQYGVNLVTEEYEKTAVKVDRILAKIDGEEDEIKMEILLDRLNHLMLLIVALERRKSDFPGADWNGLMDLISEKLQQMEDMEDDARTKIKRKMVGEADGASLRRTPSGSVVSLLGSEPDISPTSVTEGNTATGITPASVNSIPAVSSNTASTPSSSSPLMSTGYPVSTSSTSPQSGSFPFPHSTAAQSTLAPQATNVPHSAPQSVSAPQSTGFPPYTPSIAQSTGFSLPDVKVRRAELPQFSGRRKDWPEFKALFPEMAGPAFSSKITLASELRRCCEKGSALRLIENVSITGPDAIDTMWQRLVDYYEDATASVNEIMKVLQSLRTVKSEDYRYLTDFVNTVEACYAQLVTINHLDCITIRDVDGLCSLLPVALKEGWHERHLTLTSPDQLHPFQAFTRYLVERRKAVSRLVEYQPVRKKELSTHSHSGTSVTSNRKFASAPSEKPKCAVHKSGDGKHTTENCRRFLQMSREEKRSALMDVRACFRCFTYHKRGNCKDYKEPCKTCGKTGHHTLLCYNQANGESIQHVSTGGHSNTTKSIISTSENRSSTTATHSTDHKSTGIYAIFDTPCASSRHHCVVFADDGSDASYIKNASAERLGARKLNKCILEVTTTGGQETEYKSQEYELDLVTKSGKIVTVRMFGMKRITGCLSQLNLAVISKLFPGYDTSVLQRKSSEVDVLLGTDYFGLHPKREICKAGENLSIMEGSLGVCLQGSHPLLHDGVHMDSNMVKVLKTVTQAYHSVSVKSSTSVKHPIFDAPVGYTKSTCKDVTLVHTQSHLNKATSGEVQEYILSDEMGTQSTPKCGSCKCGKCPLPGHTFSFQEEVELKIIREGLQYNEENQCWTSKYPWKFDPYTLPDNYSATLATLRSLERKLQKDEEKAKTYHEQMMDMVERKAARKVPEKEIADYKGPIYYISHLGVANPKSKSTPYRIVFNSSQLCQGVSLNNWLYKGPDAYMNNQLGVLLRWRENSVAIVGDIKKMFNSVHLEVEEQHCHRFLWSNLKYGEIPDIYVMTRVNMGDRPAGTISTEALYMTAEMFQLQHPQAAVFLKLGSYVDDLLESVPDVDEAGNLTAETEILLSKGGFKIKYWLKSGERSGDDKGITEVLGVCWISESDSIVFNPCLNFSPKKQGVHILPDLTVDEVPAAIPQILTKRMVLSQVMRMYDPYGFLCPFTLQGKILLRESWESVTGWDDPLPPGLRSRWIQFLCSIYELHKLKFPRSIKPEGASGDPMLVLLSDASDKAYGVVAYARWNCEDGSFKSRFIMAKNRIAPLVKRSTPQLELNAAVLSKRAREVIEKEMRYEFTKTLHLIDSETVLAMLHKTSTRFKLYEGVRVGEVQAATGGDVSNWAWIAGSSNISDWLTRGKSPLEISEDSEWFQGPSFMSKPEEEWELKFSPSCTNTLPGEKRMLSTNSTNSKEWGLKFGAPNVQQLLPGEKKDVSSHTAQLELKNSEVITYKRFSNYRRLVRTLARVLNACRNKSLNAIKEEPSSVLIENAEEIVVKDLQKEIESECFKKDRNGRNGGRYNTLKPVLISGVWVVGTRLKFNPLVPENKPQSLLPTQHYATRLLMMQAHKEVAHRGRDTTLARFRQKHWIVQGSKVANSVVTNCQMCKYRKPKLLKQKMGNLPMERSCPAPPFTFCMVDYFGPYSVKGEVQKRISGKAWGVIFTDLVSRAVFIESVHECSADSFLIALSKFASVRGFPRVMYSDPGSNLCAASKELNEQWERMWNEEGEKIISHSSDNGLEWRFSSADSPWHNGAVEALVKSCKKILNIVMQNQRLSPSEFSGVLYGVANILNERPIGVTSVDSDLSILTPNSLLLGRSTAKNPGGWYSTSGSMKRFNLVKQIEESFWSQWIKTTAPNLITDAKWHAAADRELQVGDVVFVVDSDSFKPSYKIAMVQEVYKSSDGLIRKARVLYKSYSVGDKKVKYTPSSGQSVTRPVQKLALVVPTNS